jgi:hypothetical protein
LNITDQGFPEGVRGLEPWKRAFEKFKWSKTAFATSVVLLPDGSAPIGSSGSGFLWEWKTAPNYHPDLYRKFLIDSLTRYDKISAITTDSSLSAAQKQFKLAALSLEIMQQMRASR